MNRICRRSILFADHVAEANLTSRSAGLKINDNNKLQRLFLLCSALNIVADCQIKEGQLPYYLWLLVCSHPKRLQTNHTHDHTSAAERQKLPRGVLVSVARFFILFLFCGRRRN